MLDVVEEMLGVAYLHKAGMDSGIFRQPDDFCLLPNRPGRGYAKTTDVVEDLLIADPDVGDAVDRVKRLLQDKGIIFRPW